MPKRNPASVLAEQHVAKRIALLRQERKWSYEGLAARMTRAGVPLNQSAIYKIERGDPPRRITVDELVGYARVFNLSVEEMLTDPDVATEKSVVALLEEWHRLSIERSEVIASFDERERDIRERLSRVVRGSAKADAAMREWLKKLVPRTESPLPDDLAEYLGWEMELDE